MKKLLSFALAMAAGYCIADGPVIQTSPYMRAVIQAQNALAAQTALGFTGASNIVTMQAITNGAIGALTPATTSISNQLQYAIAASTNAPYGKVDIRQWGAKVDGQVFNGCYCSNGTTLYNPSGNFTSSMVGLECWMRFGGTNGAQDYLTTIGGYVSPNVLTVSAAPVVQTFNLPVCIGHDDSSAWQTAFNFYGSKAASVTFVVPLNPAVNYGYGISMIATNFQDVGLWPSHWNAQIHVPNFTLPGSSPAPVWTFSGGIPPLSDGLNGGDGSFYPRGAYIFPCLPYGNNSSNQLFGISFAQETGGYYLYGGAAGGCRQYPVSRLGLVFNDITFMGCFNNSYWLLNTPVERVNADRFDFTGGGLHVTDSYPTNPIAGGFSTNSGGLYFGGPYNNPGSLLQRGDFNWFYTACGAPSGNVECHNVNFYWDDVVADFNNGGGQKFTMSGLNNICPMGTVFNANGYPTMVPTTIEAHGLNCQTTGTFTNWTLVNDPSGYLNGDIEYLNQNTGPYTTNQGVCACRPYLSVDVVDNGDHGFGAMHSGAFAVSGNINGGEPQENNPKYFAWPFYNYSHGAQDNESAFMGLWAANPNSTYLIIGGAGGSNPYGIGGGVNQIDFVTSADDVGSANNDGYIDGPSGNIVWQRGSLTVQTGAVNAQDGLSVSGGQLVVSGTSGVIQHMIGTGSELDTLYDLSGYLPGNLVWRVGVEPLNTGNIPGLQDGGAAYFFQSQNAQTKYDIITTNGEVFSSSGFGSMATNSVPFSSGGITNTLIVNLRVIGFSGNGVFLTNLNTGFHYSFPSFPQNHGEMFILQPGEALVGTSCIEDTNIAW